MKRKEAHVVLEVGLVEGKQRRGSCIRVASLAHGGYLFILSRNTFISLLFKRWVLSLYLSFLVENKLGCFVFYPVSETVRKM